MWTENDHMIGPISAEVVRLREHLTFTIQCTIARRTRVSIIGQKRRMVNSLGYEQAAAALSSRSVIECTNWSTIMVNLTCLLSSHSLFFFATIPSQCLSQCIVVSIDKFILPLLNTLQSKINSFSCARPCNQLSDRFSCVYQLNFATSRTGGGLVYADCRTCRLTSLPGEIK
jgi:hypothetical protein